MPTPPSRKALSGALYDLAETNGVTHFGTLKVGLLGRTRIDPHRDLLKPLAVVLRNYARERSDLARRAAIQAADMPFLVGVVERFDRAGSLDPHFHYFISLRPAEEPWYRGFLRHRFGRDCTIGAAGMKAVVHPPGTPAMMRQFLFPLDVPLLPRPSRPFIRRRDASPTFDLQRLSADWRRAATYLVKQTDKPDIISHLDLLSI